jgi:hypothetical protein
VLLAKSSAPHSGLQLQPRVLARLLACLRLAFITLSNRLLSLFRRQP